MRRLVGVIVTLARFRLSALREPTGAVPPRFVHIL